MPKIDDKVEALLSQVVDHFDKEDRVVREMQLRRCRRMKLYWNNFSQIYWSESARDYRVVASESLPYNDNDQEFYDRPVNILRAFTETIIAALSIQIPGIACVPDDADNPQDISTAKNGDHIAELLYKHNDIIWQWLQAMYIHCTEGMVAAYCYEKSDKSYGSYTEREYKDEEVESYVCPHCQAQLEEGLFAAQQAVQQNPSIADQVQQAVEQQIQSKNSEMEQFTDEIDNQFGPDDDSADLDYEADKGLVCPECAAELDPEMGRTKLIIPRFIGKNNQAKSRICIEVYGGLYIKIANYAKKQCDTPYLIYSYETHYTNALEMYDDLWDEIPQGGWGNQGIPDPYEQYARLNPQYRNGFPSEQVTIRNAWLRPAAFNILKEEDAKLLKKKYPDGAKVVKINQKVVDACNENLDDCWTLTRDPMHDYINHDPLCELLTNIQDITNDLISLVLQTIEHGIVQTWADPSVVNFGAQKQIEAAPGTVTPTKPMSGSKNIGEAFHETKSATLAPEVFQFYQIINQLGQFVSAAMPSIFGGSQESGSSRTASEYAMSRTASLQRLQTPWRMFTIWWKEIFGKAIPAYMKLIKEDERFVKRDDNGNFANVYIRKAELAGKIGSVELDASEQIPVSDEDKAQLIMRLMELNNEEITRAFTSPENLPFIRKIVKMPEFRLPGEDDRQKQMEEIQELIASRPIPPMPTDIITSQQDPNAPPPEPLPSVEPDPLVDDHAIEAQICRNWLISEAGRLCKIENPPGYMNVMLHMKAHMAIIAQQQMQAMMTGQQPGQQPPAGQNGQQQPKPEQSSEIINGAQANAGVPIQ